MVYSFFLFFLFFFPPFRLLSPLNSILHLTELKLFTLQVLTITKRWICSLCNKRLIVVRCRTAAGQSVSNTGRDLAGFVRGPTNLSPFAELADGHG